MGAFYPAPMPDDDYPPYRDVQPHVGLITTAFDMNPNGNRVLPPQPQRVPWNIAAPLTPLMLDMLRAAAAGTLVRRGWHVTIEGRHASVVTLRKLQDRRLVGVVRITEDGRKALDLATSRTQR